MKHEKMKIIKILDEILSFSLNNQADEIDIKIKVNEEQTIIKFKDNSPNLNQDKLEEIEEMLNIEKQPEVEEYYWELIGQNDYCDELSVVGLMIDKAIITYKPQEGLEVTLYRNNQE
ncbi:hypothetical protein BX659_12416 [Orenia metallireducens]|jgi:hypothetical protein|uniref:Uncharacterized protein n=1 Tax=Orenia metallireducens TaxID=1413210 RepID=A0A285GAX4_9FIRM|nr:hypothetical protein [Orenia metallireducens]PRX24192.1 hypothetical protein BX659_12416 [Orenia metallireducens]SNY19666.1 hypothetical protein SAMN06265827_105167 [Orenia metallireducens]